jgi:hypothetical protein
MRRKADDPSRCAFRIDSLDPGDEIMTADRRSGPPSAMFGNLEFAGQAGIGGTAFFHPGNASSPRYQRTISG